MSEKSDVEPNDEDAGVIDAVFLARLADCLLMMGDTFAKMSQFLRKQGVPSIKGKGSPTAERACGYLANFTSNVQSGYQQSRLSGELDIGVSASVQAKLLATEALARNLAKKKRKGNGGTTGGTDKT